jgi:hypothetical protein
MNAKLTTRQVGDVSIVDVAGRVTAGRGSKALRETLRELTSAGKNKLLVNLCEISQGGGQLKLVGLSGQAAYQMLITKSCTFFEMYVDEGTAIRSFGQKSAEGD